MHFGRWRSYWTDHTTRCTACLCAISRACGATSHTTTASSAPTCARCQNTSVVSTSTAAPTPSSGTCSASLDEWVINLPFVLFRPLGWALKIGPDKRFHSSTVLLSHPKCERVLNSSIHSKFFTFSVAHHFASHFQLFIPQAWPWASRCHKLLPRI